jgi:plasmid maintenance system antidote protein VapI
VTKNNLFRPDWISSPGETIADLLEEQRVSPAEFARRIGQPVGYVQELVAGQAQVTDEVARQLEAALGSSAAFWLARESQYRLSLARLRPDAPATEGARWLAELPLKDMVRFEWLEASADPASQVAACLRYFDVPDVPAWRRKYAAVLSTVAFRTSPSFDSLPGAVAAWLRQGEIEGGLLDCRPWNAKRFEAALPTIRELTRQRDPAVFLPEVRQICVGCGVAVAIVRAPAGCRASGATRFLSPTRALLLMSSRYLSDDQFWFTFFHEAGHLLLHDHGSLFLEGTEVVTAGGEEGEANEFAERVLIPPEFKAAMLGLPLDGREVIRFATRVGVSPGVVVGQMQHFGRLTYRQLNNLKRRYSWAEG